jgi:hypothetical protein
MYYIYGLQEYLQMSVIPDRVVHLARGYAFDVPHGNSFSYMIALACREYLSTKYDLLTTAINPILGFTAASLRATGFVPFATAPVIYRFTSAHEVVPRRDNRGNFRGTTLITNLLTVRGCTHGWTRRLAECTEAPVEIDFALHSLSILDSASELTSQSGKVALMNIRRHLEPVWDRRTRYGKYEYSGADRESRGQCGVTSAYLARAIDRIGWHATIGRGDLSFDSGLPPILNHCWVEVDMLDTDPLIIDLTPDQTGFPEILLIGKEHELTALGTRYNRHSTIGKLSGGSKNDLGNRLAILDLNLTKGRIQ